MPVHSSISEIDLPQWHELIATSPTASFFQTPECYEFYASLSFVKPFVFGVTENNMLTGVLCGYIISDGNAVKRFFSRRAIVPGGALLDKDISPEALKALLNKVTGYLGNRAIYLELRNYNDYSAYKTILESSGLSYLPHLNFKVATPDLETTLKKLSTTKRRDVKLSGKEGATWAVTTDREDLKAYYEILSDLYKNKIKTPLFPYEFFEKLILQPFGKLFVVKHHDQVMGGSVCVLLQNRIIYEWFVCGLDGQIKNIFPSTLATWAAIEYAAMNGFVSFDMMGAGKPDEGYGVREFKSKFGGELVEHGRFLYICNPQLYSLGKYIIGKLKKK